MANGIDLEFGFRSAAATASRGEASPLRILLIGDFHGASEPPPLLSRPIHAVDIDDFDATCARIAPRCHLADGEELSFAEYDDFHPDRLCQSLPALADLLDLRRRLASVGSFDAAAAELRQRLADLPTAPDAPDAAVHTESDGDTLQRLLGHPVTTESGQSGGGALDRFVAAAVAAHIAPAAPPQQSLYLQAIDQALSDALRSCLQDPAFRSLEAAWLGLRRLLSKIETDETLQLSLLSATVAELGLALQDEPELMQRIAAGSRQDGQEPWSLIVVLHAFAGDEGSMRHLQALGRLAEGCGASLLADAAPDLLGAASLAELADPASWQPSQGWAELRQNPLSRRIGLAVPGLLLRQPYGEASDPIEAFPFEECPGEPGSLAWGSAALGITALLAEAFRHAGWGMSPDDVLTLDDLPAHVWRQDGELRRTPCAGRYLPESVVEALLASGLMPMVSHTLWPCTRSRLASMGP